MTPNRPRVFGWMIAGIGITLSACQGQCPPAPAPPPTGVQIPAAGGEHTCASLLNGTMKCWGGNQLGQLGNATRIGSRVPVEVAGLTLGPVNRPVLLGVATGGDHTCIIGSAGRIFCWGNNSDGQLGLNSRTDFDVMQPARTLTRPDGSTRLANLIAAGDRHTCAVYDPDVVACWGRTYSLVPDVISGISALRIAAGGDQTCIIGPGGIVRCWGGLLNFGPATNPTLIQGITAQSAIAVGRRHACALDQAGTIRCWGGNAFGQLGNGTNVPSATAVVVSTISTTAVVDVAAGENHTCALFASGSVECWGQNNVGQTGDPSTTSGNTRSPVQVVSSDATAITLGVAHSCARLNDGNVRKMACWGLNGSGQLGDGSTSTFSLTPVPVTGLP